MTTFTLHCGCIQKINDINPCKSNISISYNQSDYITEYKCNNNDDNCNNVEYLQRKKQLVRDNEICDLSVSKLKTFRETILSLEYEKIPIKYLKDKLLENKYIDDKDQCHYSRIGFDLTLLNIQKNNNRYYCCKNRADKYIELEIYRYYFINSFRWS
jgi:hypothetical protein